MKHKHNKKRFFTDRQIQQIFDPWPVRPSKGKYRLYPMSFSEVLKFKSCIKENGKRWSIRRMANLIERKGWGGSLRHSIRGMARKRVANKWVLGQKRGKDGFVIYDGNHSMSSLLLQGYKGSILVIEKV